jgi:transketolase
MHLDHTRIPGVEVSTGSLGHGLGMAVGLALAARLRRQPWRTVCLLSDGELFEGSIWEAAMSGAGFGLDRLVAVIDRNRLTMDGFTEVEMPLEPVADKWAAFGWATFACDGHDLPALCRTLHQAFGVTGRPAVIIAETTKGKGIDFMEDDARWHYGALDSDMYERARASIDRHHRRQLDRLPATPGAPS